MTMQERTSGTVDLTQTSNRDYRPGRSYFVRALWLVAEAVLFANPVVTSYRLKRGLLRAFGASVGNGVLIKPGARVKYPWRLAIGDHSWLGERAWIDNMEDVRIGANVVVSQGAYLCTGNHDWSDPTFKYFGKPIIIGDSVWITAGMMIGPGTIIPPCSVLLQQPSSEYVIVE